MKVFAWGNFHFPFNIINSPLFLLCSKCNYTRQRNSFQSNFVSNDGTNERKFSSFTSSSSLPARNFSSRHVQCRLCWLRQDLLPFFSSIHRFQIKYQQRIPPQSSWTTHESNIKEQKEIRLEWRTISFSILFSFFFRQWNFVHPQNETRRKTMGGWGEIFQLTSSHTQNEEFKFKRNSMKSNNERIRSIFQFFPFDHNMKSTFRVKARGNVFEFQPEKYHVNIWGGNLRCRNFKSRTFTVATFDTISLLLWFCRSSLRFEIRLNVLHFEHQQKRRISTCNFSALSFSLCE